MKSKATARGALRSTLSAAAKSVQIESLEARQLLSATAGETRLDPMSQWQADIGALLPEGPTLVSDDGDVTAQLQRRGIPGGGPGGSTTVGPKVGNKPLQRLDSPGRLTLETMGVVGGVTNDNSGHPALSDAGDRVVYISDASNLVDDDTNGFGDVFLYDTATDTTTRVSIATNGTQANADSFDPQISADGRLVLFSSTASNLVPGDTNGGFDVFVHDTQSGETFLASRNAAGNPGNGPSYAGTFGRDGELVAFTSAATDLVANDTNEATDIFVLDLTSNTMSRASTDYTGEQSAGDSYDAMISRDGNTVVYTSIDATMVPGDTNGLADIFVHDRMTATTQRVSISTDGATQAASRVHSPEVSADGSRVVFIAESESGLGGETHYYDAVFVRDLIEGTTTNVSRNAAGELANRDTTVPTISGNGQFVFFQSRAFNFIAGDTIGIPSNVFRKDLATGAVERLNDRNSGGPSAVGAYAVATNFSGDVAAFGSTASDLVANDYLSKSDIFRWQQSRPADSALEKLTGGDLIAGFSDSAEPVFDPTGRYMIFRSIAPNLVADDTNGVEELFIRDLKTGTTERFDLVGFDGQPLNRSPIEFSLSSDGRYLAFASSADNVLDFDRNFQMHAYLYDRQTGDLELLNVSDSGVIGDRGGRSPVVSADGRFVAFESVSTNLVDGVTAPSLAGSNYIFLRDRLLGTTTHVTETRNPDTNNGFPFTGNFIGGISDDGQTLAYIGGRDIDAFNGTPIGNGTHAYLYNHASGQTRLLTLADVPSNERMNATGIYMTPDGRFVSFSVETDALVPGDDNEHADAVLYDVAADSFEIVSRRYDGSPTTDHSSNVGLSDDGRYAFFATADPNIVLGNGPVARNVFRLDRTTGLVQRASFGPDGEFVDDDVRIAVPSPGGDRLAFVSESRALSPLSLDNIDQIYIAHLNDSFREPPSPQPRPSDFPLLRGPAPSSLFASNTLNASDFDADSPLTMF